MIPDRDPDRLISAFLDEGPRTFSPALLQQTLGAIHHDGGAGRRSGILARVLGRPGPRLALIGSFVLLVLVGAGALLPGRFSTLIGPGPSPTPQPSGPERSAPPSSDVPAFVGGDVPFQGTDWLLVGRSNPERAPGDPVLVAVPPAANVWLRVADGGFQGSTGCFGAYGIFNEVPDGDRTTPLELLVVPLGTFPCTDAQRAEDQGIVDRLERAAAMQVTRGGFDLLASGLADADVDPMLLAHYRDHPDLTRLIIRDASGEGTLVYAPVAPGFVRDPQLPDNPAPELVGPLWGLMGWWDGTELQTPYGAREAALRFAADGTFAGGSGCGPISGVWGRPDASGTVVPVPIELAPAPSPNAVASAAPSCDEQERQQSEAVRRLLPGIDLGTGLTVTQAPLEVIPKDRLDWMVRGVIDRRGPFAVWSGLLSDAAGDVVLIYTPLGED